MAAVAASGAVKHEVVANLERVRGLVSAASKKLRLKAEVGLHDVILGPLPAMNRWCAVLG